MILAHFIKRELETILCVSILLLSSLCPPLTSVPPRSRPFNAAHSIHRFSKSTMPFTYVFRNSAHYWLLGGFFLATALYGPRHGSLKLRHTPRDDPFFLNTCVVIWVVLELMNFSTHWTLMSLRPKGTRMRGIPRGPLFAKVSCPNYTTEIAGWSVIWFMTGDFWCMSAPFYLPSFLSKSHFLPSSLAFVGEPIFNP